MKYFLISLIVLIISCKKEDCIILNIDAGQHLVCGKKIYSRDYGCHNNQVTKNIKIYRKEYTDKGKQYCNDGWCGLKPFLENHRGNCPVIWKLDKSEFTKNRVKDRLLEMEKNK